MTATRRDFLALAANAAGAGIGWDAIGAKTFGYPVFWFNPAHQPIEEVGEAPGAIGTSFAGLMTFLQA
jgi:2-haloacid dehalogenase